MMADSAGSAGANLLLWMSADWSAVMTPPIRRLPIVIGCDDVSVRVVVSELWIARTPATPTLASEGPAARMNTCFEPVP